MRGQFRGENFAFQIGDKIFPTKILCAIWGTSCSLCILSGDVRQVLLRCCRQSMCLSRLFILLALE